MVCGLPGVGKTTVAKTLADKTKSFVLSTDTIRKIIIDKPRYTKKEKELVYDVLLEMTKKFLANGKNVIIDGTFYRKALRKRAEKLADETNNKFYIIEVVCPEKTVIKRLKERQKKGSLSDADFGVYMKIKREFEPIREKHFTVNTGGQWEKQIEKFLKNSA